MQTSGLQIAKRRRAHVESRPDSKIISLGIGDTTEPIPQFVADAMAQASKGLGTLEGYSGYVGMMQPALVLVMRAIVPVARALMWSRACRDTAAVPRARAQHKARCSASSRPAAPCFSMGRTGGVAADAE